MEKVIEFTTKFIILAYMGIGIISILFERRTIKGILKAFLKFSFGGVVVLCIAKVVGTLLGTLIWGSIIAVVVIFLIAVIFG